MAVLQSTLTLKLTGIYLVFFICAGLHISNRGGGGGGDSLINVGTDVRRVQNLGRAKFPKTPNARASFHEL